MLCEYFRHEFRNVMVDELLTIVSDCLFYEVVRLHYFTHFFLIATDYYDSGL